MKCVRCSTELPDQRGSFWKEPVIFCTSCGHRYRRESRLDRASSLGVLVPFVVAAAVGWAATALLIILLTRNRLWSSLGHVSVVVVLFTLCTLLTRHLVPGVRDMVSPREIMSLEK